MVVFRGNVKKSVDHSAPGYLMEKHLPSIWEPIPFFLLIAPSNIALSRRVRFVNSAGCNVTGSLIELLG